jgi:hypothetical protein
MDADVEVEEDEWECCADANCGWSSVKCVCCFVGVVGVVVTKKSFIISMLPSVILESMRWTRDSGSHGGVCE